MLTYLLFAIGFFFLIKGASFLVDGASALAKKWGVSELAIGLTVVAFGTSAPELIVNIIASFKGTADIALGNIIGSNISNILLILGVTALISPLAIKRGTVWKEIPFSVAAVAILFYLANDVLLQGKGMAFLSRYDGLAMIIMFSLFIFYAFFNSRLTGEEKIDVQTYSFSLACLMIFVGSLGLFLGGKWIIEGAIVIAQNLGISQAMIGLTIIAIGTSLPELATCVIASLKKNADIAIGNIIGSNIFNILWVLGLSSLIRPLSFNVDLNTDIVLLGLVTFLLFFFLIYGKKNLWDFLKGKIYILERWEGLSFIIIYILYIISVVIRR
jgi:cation:H+ antiporter